MSLLTYEDIQNERNIDLTDPNGQVIAEALIASAIAWVEKYVGYRLEQSEQTAYFSDGYEDLWLPSAAPVSAVALSYKSQGTYVLQLTDRFDWDESGAIQSYDYLPCGMKAVKVVYTAGWTAETLPKDLRDAIIDMVAMKLQAVANFSSSAMSTEGESEEEGEETATPTGPLKKLSVDGYSEEYSTAETDAYWKAKSIQMSRSIGEGVTPSITEVVASYRRPFAL